MNYWVISLLQLVNSLYSVSESVSVLLETFYAIRMAMVPIIAKQLKRFLFLILYVRTWYKHHGNLKTTTSGLAQEGGFLNLLTGNQGSLLIRHTKRICRRSSGKLSCRSCPETHLRRKITLYYAGAVQLFVCLDPITREQPLRSFAAHQNPGVTCAN